MKILGTGIDIVENLRIKRSLNNDQFITRIFSTNEILLSKNVKDKTGYYSKGLPQRRLSSNLLVQVLEII
jgi:holo-[acyl-carrier protein] synthase